MRGIVFGLLPLLLMACLPSRLSLPTSTAVTVTKERPPLATQATSPLPLATAEAPSTPQAQVTSRGDQLVASDPQTVRVGKRRQGGQALERFRISAGI